MEWYFLSGFMATQGGGKSFLDSMVYAFIPIVKVFIVCSIGCLMASKYVNILPLNGRKLLNGLVFSLLLPCLIFSQLGQAVTIEKIMKWWFIPVNVVLSAIVGTLVGYIIACIVRPPYPYFKFTIVHIGTSNVGNVPLVLISSLCQDAKNPFGDSDKCRSDGVAYLAFGQWVAALIVYTFVFEMLAPPPGGSFDIFEEKNLPIKDLHTIPSSEQVPLLLSQDLRLLEFPSKKGKLASIVQILTEKLKLELFLQPPMIASMLAMVTGSVPFLKGMIFVDDAPFFFLADSFIILGQYWQIPSVRKHEMLRSPIHSASSLTNLQVIDRKATTPCVLLALGANLVDGPGSAKVGMRTTSAIIIGRLLVVPPIGLGIVTIADKLGLLPEGDKMFMFILLLQHSMPTSVLCGAVANLRGCGRESAAVLFWVNIFAIFTMGGWIALYLNLLF